ncbi:MAG TPA: UDP-3-O-(3-hydroxymyristoyl)glucosamine N-acyltransferase [Burkholderiaceae bacterium]|nr:UDP-3-O-(3-hydroxymyristoyl)glucosamine N-acyltransferase [Burkholderiaceae bacterium]
MSTDPVSLAAAPERWSVAKLVQSVAQLSAGRLAAADIELFGSPDRVLNAVAPLDQATASQLSFLSNPRYRHLAGSSQAGAIVLNHSDRSAVFSTVGEQSPTLIVCAHPYAWFAYAAQLLAPRRATSQGMSERAVVHPTAQVSAQACVEALAIVQEGARVEAGAVIAAGAYVGRYAVVRAHARLEPGAKLLDACELGERSVLYSGAVIGADGFGFAPFEGTYIKIPQTGRVCIGQDVEIGANTTIDRGTMGDTVIEDGVKIDNQVQIGHNCRIGAHTVIAGCVGIAGSAVIGSGCQIGGAAMIAGHLSVAAGSVIGPGTLISRSIAEANFYTGFFPFMKNRDWEKNAAVLRQLSQLRERLRQVEKQHHANDKD